MFVLLRRIGDGAADTTLRVCHETRKALEAVVSGIATCAVVWPNRGATLPAGICWRVRAIGWGIGRGFSIGQGSRLGQISGRFTVEAWQVKGGGGGLLSRHADIIRDAFDRLTPTMPAGMELQLFVPSGPRYMNEKGRSGVAVTVPFEVIETITS
jgi:hypothetical protein